MGRRQVAETCLKLGKQNGSLWAGRGRPVLLGFRASRLKTSWGGLPKDRSLDLGERKSSVASSSHGLAGGPAGAPSGTLVWPGSEGLRSPGRPLPRALPQPPPRGTGLGRQGGPRRGLTSSDRRSQPGRPLQTRLAGLLRRALSLEPLPQQEDGEARRAAVRGVRTARLWPPEPRAASAAAPPAAAGWAGAAGRGADSRRRWLQPAPALLQPGGGRPHHRVRDLRRGGPGAQCLTPHRGPLLQVGWGSGGRRGSQPDHPGEHGAEELVTPSCGSYSRS